MSLLRMMGIGFLALVALVSLGYAGYSSMNPHTVTVTQQQLLTNTQNLYTTQTQTVTSVNVVTSQQTVTTTTNAAGNVYTGSNYYSQNCGYYGCYYYGSGFGSISDVCKSTDGNNTVQCQGYIYEPSSRCVELAVPYLNPDWMETTGYMYVTLFNMPANAPAPGAFVTVTGQLNQGYTPSPDSPACTANYITVTSIS